jgi:oxygen-independent coproporphyrinogen-3 oxidase
MAGIYLHIPFCKQACHYCDFHFSTNTKLRKDVVEAISKEIKIQEDYLLGDTIETIYFGGGTPSLLLKDELKYLLDTISSNYEVSTTAEITLEANPDDLTKDKLDQLSSLGVNRLSIGVQSFDDSHLTFLNRAHTSTEALSCIENARNVGINNISIDLIYAIPSDDHSIWEKDLKQALALKPDHISSYCLTIENKTAFGNWLKQGKIAPISDEYAAQQFEILTEVLDRNGYEQYEVSNFCLPQQYSKHNSNYWKQEKYLGVGPSAHSYNGINRQYNISNNKRYVEEIGKGITPFTLDELDREDHINEYLLTTLRTKWGVNLNKLKKKHNDDLLERHREYIDDLIEQELAVLDKENLTLTNKGKLFADKIASDLFLV